MLQGYGADPPQRVCRTTTDPPMYRLELRSVRDSIAWIGYACMVSKRFTILLHTGARFVVVRQSYISIDSGNNDIPGRTPPG